jgi:hypothetical protein
MNSFVKNGCETFRCPFCRLTFIVNPESIKFHKFHRCIDLTKIWKPLGRKRKINYFKRR